MTVEIEAALADIHQRAHLAFMRTGIHVLSDITEIARAALTAERKDTQRAVEIAVSRADRLREALEAALPVIDYVSRGRGYIGVEPYPDATARRANALAVDVLAEVILPGGPA